MTAVLFLFLFFLVGLFNIKDHRWKKIEFVVCICSVEIYILKLFCSESGLCELWQLGVLLCPLRQRFPPRRADQPHSQGRASAPPGETRHRAAWGLLYSCCPGVGWVGDLKAATHYSTSERLFGIWLDYSCRYLLVASWEACSHHLPLSRENWINEPENRGPRFKNQDTVYPNFPSFEFFTRKKLFKDSTRGNQDERWPMVCFSKERHIEHVKTSDF